MFQSLGPNHHRLHAFRQARIGWILRFLFVWGVVSLLRPPSSRAPLAEQQTVETTKPHVCVHTLLENEVHEWKIQRSLESVRRMGASTIVQFFPWAYFERQDNHYTWNQADLIVRHAQNQGLHIIARLGLVPAWARPDRQDTPTTLNYLPDDSFKDFADFAADFARRYQDVINHIIIWNEPNLSFEWGYRPVDPAAYVRLLAVTYPGIKGANPNALVLAGALAPTNEARGSPAGLNEMDYLRDMYENGAAGYFDALAVHSYGFRDPPDAPPDKNRLNFRRAELLRDIMVAYDSPDKLAYITESGWNDHARWSLAVQPAQRSIYTVQAFEYAEENWDWVKQLCIWALRYPAPLNSYPDNSTLVTPEFTLKPIYYAIQSYARGWDRSDALWLPPPQEN